MHAAVTYQIDSDARRDRARGEVGMQTLRDGLRHNSGRGGKNSAGRYGATPLRRSKLSGRTRGLPLEEDMSHRKNLLAVSLCTTFH